MSGEALVQTADYHTSTTLKIAHLLGGPRENHGSDILIGIIKTIASFNDRPVQLPHFAAYEF